MSKDEIEALIQAKGLAKGLTRPRLTPQDVDDTIKAEAYTTLPSGKVMVCELTLRNGFTVRGEAAAVNKANFSAEVGRKISRENARNKVWELEGYLLQQRLYDDLLGRNTHTERDMKTQWWLAELDVYGNPKLADGAHDKRDGAEAALTLIQRLGFAKERRFAIAEVRLTEPTGEHGPLNEEAIATLNAIGLRPNA